VLRRTPHDTRVECLRAVTAESAAAQPGDKPLAHDLRAGRAAAGTTDASNLDFIPIRWQVRLLCACPVACTLTSS
jgi:hypothetical protein